MDNDVPTSGDLLLGKLACQFNTVATETDYGAASLTSWAQSHAILYHSLFSRLQEREDQEMIMKKGVQQSIVLPLRVGR